MPPSSVSVRRSIRWLPDPANEPTKTIVLTGGKTGVFLDVRFIKGSNELDWAFAGYRYQVSANMVEFKHHIDSRTLDPLLVIDVGTTTVLEDGQIVEVGKMVNPATGQISQYEEVWEEDIDTPSSAVFIRNRAGTAWQAQVDSWQLGMGRDDDGVFWAWQAVKGSTEDKDDLGKEWQVIHCTSGKPICILPNDKIGWNEGSYVEWNGKQWEVLENSTE